MVPVASSSFSSSSFSSSSPISPPILVDSGLVRLALKSSRGDGDYPALILNYIKKIFVLIKFIYYLLV